MPVTLIIVESPAKTRTLRSFLGPGYRAEASMGHVRDLPEKKLGVAVDKGFQPTYVIIPERRDAVKKLKEAASKADRILLASDPDREGEAIAYHVAHVLKLPNPERIEFNEITKSAVLSALEHPRPIDMRRVEAQEARRVLDRLVGYKLSPLLWKKVKKGLSAGRVQSVVLRLICDREREIRAFVPQEYWSLTARLQKRHEEKPAPFEARLVERDGEKLELKNEAETMAIVRELEGASYVVANIKQRDQRRNPQPPFTTSTLQQAAATQLGFSNRKTMIVAQQLYEGISLGEAGAVGLITYMRTDSVRVAPEAQAMARQFVLDRFGEKYLPKKLPVYKSASTAQEAHEAIRPTSVERTPEQVAPFLDADQRRLYELIWRRFVASQMVPAILTLTTVDIKAGRYTFRANGSVVKFDGYMRVQADAQPKKEQGEQNGAESTQLPSLTVGEELDLLELLPKQHFTEPPPRYTEATLVKTLDEKGIGRPSTWATFISTILERGYVVLEDRKFRPTELGFRVNDLLVKHFPTIMDYDFTSLMETKLDEIEQGKAERLPVLQEFYEPFMQALALADERLEAARPKPVETDFVCPTCGRKMLLRQSERGPFLGCSGYPRCKTILNPDGSPIQPDTPPETAGTETACPKCGKPMVVRQGKFGSFLGCSGYPRCKTLLPLPGSQPSPVPEVEKTGVACPKDGGDIVVRRSRKGAVFYGCVNYPNCDYVTWHRPVGKTCPQCGWPLGEKRFRGKATGAVVCTNPDCAYQERVTTEQAEEVPAASEGDA